MSTPSADPSADDRDPARDTGAHAWPTTRDGETYVAGTGTPVAPQRRSRAGSHLTSVVLCVVLTLVALVLVDYAVSHSWSGSALAQRETALPLEAWVPMAIGAGLLVVVALLARASGLGALIAGLLWGAAPSVLLVLFPARFDEVVRDLPDPYDAFGTGLLDAVAVFPVLGALLVGIGLAGRWRTRKPVDTV